MKPCPYLGECKALSKITTSMLSQHRGNAFCIASGNKFHMPVHQDAAHLGKAQKSSINRQMIPEIIA
eukprot:1148073-Pelagomonas_calceolata.AAC.10